MTTTNSSDTLHFDRWELPPETSLPAIFPIELSRCGIYVLEFKNGECYVGQTVDIFSRFSAHSRRWPDDIIALRFAPTIREDLDKAESDTIARLESSNCRLRNMALLLMPMKSDALNLLVDEAVVEEWLTDDSGVLVLDNRGKIAAKRLETKQYYETLASHDDFTEVVKTFSEYIRMCIPWPHKTEGNFWAISSMPTTGKTARAHRLGALCINSAEVLVLGETRQDKEEPWKPSGFMNLAPSAELEANGIPESIGVLERVDYASVAGGVLQLRFDGYKPLQEALAIPEVLKAASKLAIGMLRKGPSLYRRYHDYNLSDDIFRYLEDINCE